MRITMGCDYVICVASSVSAAARLSQCEFRSDFSSVTGSPWAISLSRRSTVASRRDRDFSRCRSKIAFQCDDANIFPLKGNQPDLYINNCDEQLHVSFARSRSIVSADAAV